MLRITPLLAALVFITFCPAIQSQNETQGQPVQELFQLSYWNLRTHGKMGHFEFYDPEEPDAFIGVWDAEGNNAACQKIVTVHGILSYTLPAWEPYIVGISLAEPLYTDSPGSSWDDFGKYFSADTGKAIDRAFRPRTWSGYNADQFQHMPDEDMWKMVSDDPGTTTNWLNALPGLPSFLDEFPWGIAAPLGPGKFFNQIKPFLAALPPSTSAGGGSLIGMNLVLQVGVLDTNGSTPVAPKFTLTNAIGIQAMAGPPIKLNAGSGGNWGPPLGSITFNVEKPNISMTADVPRRNGGTTRVPVNVIDGSTISVRLPASAETGTLAFNSSVGPVETLNEPTAIVTHTDVEDLAIVGTPSFTVAQDDNGNRVFGTSVIGNVTQIANKILSIPVPPDYALYDLKVELYPLDRTKMIAGADANIPITVGVSPVGVFPVLGNAISTNTNAPSNVTVLEQSFNNLSGPIDITLATNVPALAGVDFLANIRIVEK